MAEEEERQANKWKDVPVPAELTGRPRDERGYPVPFTAHQLPDGKWDFRTIDEDQRLRCIREELCSLCGKPLDYWKFFIGGPISLTQTLLFTDPPMHEACANYAVKVCPFLAHDTARYSKLTGEEQRVDKNMSDKPGPVGILRCRGYQTFNLAGHATMRAKRVAGYQMMQELGEGKQHG